MGSTFFSHAKLSFVDELKELLRSAGIEYDEKYLL